MSAKEIFAMTISTLNYLMKSKMKILMTKFPFTAPTNVKNLNKKKDGINSNNFTLKIKQ